MIWGPDGWWWGWIMMITFWVMIVLLIVLAVRGSRRADPHGPSDAERMLDERFASGEIDAEEYATRRKVLHHRR